MKIRKMATGDYEAVFSLWKETAGMGLRSQDDSREGIERFLARNPNTCFVAEVNATVSGVILCGHDGRRGYIYHMAVAQMYRKKGIGHRLLSTALSALRAEGINRAALVVYKNNAQGNSFWESEGFSLRDDLNYRNLSLNEDNV